MHSLENIIVVVSILLLISIIASKASSRFGIPALLVFLAIGMLAGSEGPGGIFYDDPKLTQSIGVIALILILYAGGLSTQWQSVRPVLWKGLGLSTLGVSITAILVGLFSCALLDVSLYEGLLLGAIVSSTDAAAVFSVLRSRSVSLKDELKPLLELESGSNDPMAIFLTIGFIHLLTHPTASIGGFALMFVQQMLVGAVLGFVFGKLAIKTINRVNLEYDGLYPVLSIALVALVYGVTALLGGNGFLAVYIAAIVLGNSEFIHKKSLLRFHDGLAWLMQIVMFLTLGLLVYPSHVVAVASSGVLLSLFLMLVARPVSVFVTLPFTRIQGKLMVAWVGLRGAVPIILATYPLLAGLPRAELFFNIVFFVVLTSVLLQGTSLPRVAKWLKVDAPLPARTPVPLELMPSGVTKNDLVEIIVPESSDINGKRIIELGLPKGVLVVFISRGAESFVPTGATMLQAGDALLLLATKENLAQVCSTIGTQCTPL